MLDCVTREAVVSVGVESVWGALTDSTQVARWFGDGASIDLRVGGTVRFTWPAGEVSKGVVTAVEAPHRFAFRWDVFGSTRDPGAFTQVEFAVEPVADGTLVRVTETGLVGLAASGGPATPEEVYQEHVDGWRNEISDLVQYVESAARTLPLIDH